MSELGYTRNLLCADYALPHPGDPLDCPAADAQARQPALCTLDLEAACGPCQPVHAPCTPAPNQPPVYATDPTANILDRALAVTRGWLRWFSWPLGGAGFAAALADVNFNSGNLVLSLRAPNAGTADPPLQFTYNSQSTEQTEYGYGWTGLYRQRVLVDGHIAWLYKMENHAGLRW